MKKKVITEKFTEALKEMKVGERVNFPLEKAPTIATLVGRLKLTMWQEDPSWTRASVDRENGLVTYERTA